MGSNYGWWVALYVLTPVVGIVFGRAYNARKRGSTGQFFEGQTLLFSVGAVLAILFFWPLVIVVFAIEPLAERLKHWRYKQQDRFHSRPEHLLGNATVHDAEAGAVVVDPLGRVPALPFGHLNAAWKAFLEKKKFWYRLQKFHIPGTLQGQKAGYAWVVLGRVKAEFIYEWG
jgi:hypothetical protein